MKHAEVSLPMGVQEIQACIPHRYPFLLIDKITDFKSLERIVAVKNVTSTEPHLQGHFPGNPVMPGVLIVEGMAQAAAVFGHLSSETGCNTCLLTELKAARFRRPVVPGEVLVYECICKRTRRDFYWFDGVARIGDEEVADVSFSAFMR